MLRNLFASFTWLKALLLHGGFSSGYSSPCVFQVGLGDAGFALTARGSMRAEMAFRWGFRATRTTMGLLNGGNLHVWLRKSETWVRVAPAFLLSSLVSHNLKLSWDLGWSVSFLAPFVELLTTQKYDHTFGKQFWGGKANGWQSWEEEYILTNLCEWIYYSFTKQLC